MEKAKEILRKNAMLLALLAVIALFQILIMARSRGGWLTPGLFTPSNVTNFIGQNSYVVILATGMLLCILTGGNIDLSVGSVVALIGAAGGVMLVNFKLPPLLAIFLCLLMGVLIGSWQAFWIAYMRIPPFIVTLAGMLSFRGLALIILNGKTISPFPQEFTRYFNSYLPGPTPALTTCLAVGVGVCLALMIAEIFSRARKRSRGYEVEDRLILTVRLVFSCAAVMLLFCLLGYDKGIPVILVLLTAIVLAYSYYTNSTVPGRHLYAMGGNEKAAKLSGIDTNKTLFFAYANMGFLAAVAAMAGVSRFNSAAPTAGSNYELDAIGACFIGGASAYGGVGAVGGVVIGAVFMGVLNNGMSFLGVDQNWQLTTKGLVLLAAVVFDVLSKKRRQSI